MPKKYEIKPLFLMVKDEKSTKFHVKNDDYFGTMATILNLLKQEINKNDSSKRVILNKTLDSLEKDLVFLQNNYQINPKIKNKNKMPDGKLISQ